MSPEQDLNVPTSVTESNQTDSSESNSSNNSEPFNSTATNRSGGAAAATGVARAQEPAAAVAAPIETPALAEMNVGRDATVSEVIEHSLTTERLENGAAAATATAAGITSEAIPAAETA